MKRTLIASLILLSGCASMADQRQANWTDASKRVCAGLPVEEQGNCVSASLAGKEAQHQINVERSYSLFSNIGSAAWNVLGAAANAAIIVGTVGLAMSPHYYPAPAYVAPAFPVVCGWYGQNWICQ